MTEDMFSRKFPNTTDGIVADFRAAMERLELGDYARALGKQAATKMALPSEFAGSLGTIKIYGLLKIAVSVLWTISTTANIEFF